LLNEIADFLKEARRILRPNGILKIAEVRSRFEGEKNGIKKFIRVLKKAGFDCVDKYFDNKMFFILECIKVDRTPVFDDSYSPKACLYKKR
jgi:ribosomal RNA-processing protein 8